MAKIKFLILGLLYWGNASSQVKFIVSPSESIVGDSTFLSLTNSKAYNYFKQKFDSTYVFMIEPVKYQQIAAVNIKDECGYFEISYNKVALCRFQIRENKIEGIGVMFDNTGHIRVQSLFKNDKLNGVTMIYDKQGIIQEILLYRNGKYKKHLYHIAAKTRKDIVRGNKKSHDPFIEHIITM